MKKFFILVKKEIRELMTPQMIVPLLAVVLVFNFIGKIIGKEVEKSKAPQPIEIVDLDWSASSQSVIEIVKKANFAPNVSGERKEEVLAKAREKREKAMIVIPAGFENGIKNFQPQKIEVYTIMRNFSVTGYRDAEILKGVVAAINEGLSSQMIVQAASNHDPVSLKRPVLPNEFVVIGQKQANVSAAAVSGFITSQTTFIPIILFLVIVFASQMIATSIASEKENKTLETLLSAPVSRKFIVASKLFAAGLVALVTAVVYLFGMRSYMAGMAGGSLSAGLDEASKNAISQLGLQFSSYDYALLGLTLFFAILAALAIAFILGSFAQDTKAAQSVIAPLMVLILIPYFLTMFLDFSSAAPWLKYLVYAIPFSHAFLAAPNLLLNQYQNVWLGIGYLALFFVVAVIIASKIFSTEKIFTLRLKFKRK